MFEKLRLQLKNKLSNVKNERVKTMIENCFFNTIDTTLKIEKDSYFLITGDIDAMWLRDSSFQLMQYLFFVDDKDVQSLIKGILKKQFELLLIDPYANAFMINDSKKSYWEDKVKTNEHSNLVWERKFELDSICLPFFLMCKYLEKTNDKSIINNFFYQAFDKLIETLEIEMNHETKSDYFFYRVGKHIEICKAKSNKESGFVKGLVYSGFRPSDDICKYHYNIPDNMLVVSILSSLEKVVEDTNRKNKCKELIKLVKEGIETYGIKDVKGLGKIYVYETNCKGKYVLDDDANIPSLLSIPYLSYPYMDKDIYNNTRKYILSKNNKNYYEGKFLKGIGSVHTKGKRVWPLSICMQGITSNNKQEINDCFNMLISTDANTNYIHESINVNNPNDFSRAWFSWANSLFSEFVLSKMDDLNI